ncbi:hypothetical protein D0861_03960 [Hortaea werneckii]|uniref:Uncharacterized protein n=1 Tax=Hortaea werneckii TaxID=91943 RepID=A0A3M7FLX5_HORWE|nr:hypothetical protein D0861_03960 [Hortaea werneckii]
MANELQDAKRNTKTALIENTIQDHAIENISSCLKAVGSDWSNIVRWRICTLDIAYLPTIQVGTKRYSSEPWLAKKGALIETEVIAEA